jgi:predicted MFS family arabinose efflux permease
MFKIKKIVISTEGKAILALALVYLLNILDAMLIMPLIPDFAIDLQIDLGAIGYFTAIYSLTAALSGIAFSLYLDYFDRKKALIASFIGIIIANLLGCFAWNENSLLICRLLAGAAAGPNYALMLALISDIIPASRRGAALGKVLGAFAIASALGIPFCLEIAHLFGWRMAFFILVVAGTIVTSICIAFLPAGTNEVARSSIKNRINHLATSLNEPAALSSFAFTLAGMIAGFLIIPNLASYLQLNRGFPREYMGVLYLCGGACSFFSMRMVGTLVDKYGAFLVSVVNTIAFSTTLLLGIILQHNLLPTLAFFVIFMVTMSARSVCGQTLVSKIPSEKQRAAFMSINSTMSNLGSTVGAAISAFVLTQGSNMIIIGMEKVALIAISFSLIIPILIWNTERLLEKRKSAKSNCFHAQL